MISSEGEKVPLGKNLKARGYVEDWLSQVRLENQLIICWLRYIVRIVVAQWLKLGGNLYVHSSRVTIGNSLWIGIRKCFGCLGKPKMDQSSVVHSSKLMYLMSGTSNQ